MELIDKKDITVLFAGDSGDGIQLTGTQFTQTSALFGNDISTFPNFPAEIRAPQGTVAGVSGYQLKFGSEKLFTPGDNCDVLVVMNAAALKANISKLKEGGNIIANIEGFDKKNLRLAGMEDEGNPLENTALDRFNLIKLEVTKLTREVLKESELSKKDQDRCKNMFVLGYLYWMYNRDLGPTKQFLEEKFAKKPEILAANLKVLLAGYNFGDTNEQFTSRYHVQKAKQEAGTYRSVTGNMAVALGLISASVKAKREIVYGSYPITPASDILHELSKHKNFRVKTFQAEDEIAAVCAAIGASYGGSIGITASSGPGIALKGEAIGLAAMLELPLIVINVQRGGPSTGLPTKTEQADLLQAFYGRNGECPIPILSACTPKDCFNMAFEAVRIAIEHMTPVFFLSDGFIANGAEPWKYPSSAELKTIIAKVAKEESDQPYLPYRRDLDGVREWAYPGMKGFEHRVGGLEKEDETGNVSYDPANHQLMVNNRANKVKSIAKHIPEQGIEEGEVKGKLLVLGWGSTFGAIKTAVKICINDGMSVSHAHIKYLNPFPKNLSIVLSNFDQILIPEINSGQLIKIIDSEFKANTIGYNKVEGMPFSSTELVAKIKTCYES